MGQQVIKINVCLIKRVFTIYGFLNWMGRAKTHWTTIKTTSKYKGTYKNVQKVQD